MGYKITVDKKTCIGCGACTAICNNFEMKAGKAIAKKAAVTDIGCNQDASDSCPVAAIKIEKTK